MENPYPFARKELADFSLHSKRLTLSLCSLIAHTLCYGLGLFYLFLVLSLSNLISLYVMSLLPFDQHNGCNTHRSPKDQLVRAPRCCGCHTCIFEVAIRLLLPF